MLSSANVLRNQFSKCQLPRSVVNCHLSQDDKGRGGFFFEANTVAKKVISLSAITMDGSTQMRARMDDEFIDELAELYQGEHEIPPPTVFWDGTAYWLGDGHHRVHGALKAELKGLEVVVINGTHQDAILHACAANDDHGLRRTAADKRKSIKTLLEDKLWRTRSDRWIADTCRSGKDLVATIRKQLSDGGNADASPKTRKTSDGREYTVPEKNGAKPKPGEEIFPFDKYFDALNTLTRLQDRLYHVHGLVRPDGATNRDAEFEGLRRSLEAYHQSFETRWFQLAKTRFPKQ